MFLALPFMEIISTGQIGYSEESSEPTNIQVVRLVNQY